MKRILKVAFEYIFLASKLLIALLYVLFQSIFIALAYFVIDLGYSCYQKYQEDEKTNLSDEKQSAILENTKKINEKLAKEQEEYIERTEKTRESLTLLNKLLSDSEIRQSELLNIASTAQFFQVFVYATPLSEVNNILNEKYGLKMKILKRQYPVFLKGLGFARMGRFSPNFIINKNNLKNRKLADIRKFKKFLMYHFSKIRKKEWEEYLEKVKSVSADAHDFIKDKDNNNENYLLINFLLTEANINITNIGYVDFEHLGLANIKSGDNDNVNNQILLGTEITDSDDLANLKIKIKKIIDRQDLSLLLQGAEQKSKSLILSNQNDILSNLGINKILEISNINVDDLKNEIIKLNIEEEESEKIAKRIFDKADEFTTALENLGVNI